MIALAASFQPVFDSRKRKVPGLWLRRERYHARLRVDLGNSRTAPCWLPLAATMLDATRSELGHKKTERRDAKLPRAVNLNAIALRNVLKLARGCKHIERLPEFQ